MSEPLLSSKEVKAEIASRSNLYDEATRSAFLLGAIWGGQTVRSKMEARAQPAQAVPVLTDAEIDDAIPAPTTFGQFEPAWNSSDMRILRRTARAIEQLVREKMQSTHEHGGSQ